MNAGSIRFPRTARLIFLAALVSGFLVTMTHSQTASSTAVIRIWDETGALVPQVNLKLEDPRSGFSRELLGGESGISVVPLLHPGSYTITASLAGFRTEVLREVRLQVGMTVTVDIVLGPGSPDELIEVRADFNALRSTAQVVGEVIEGSTIASMPLNGRQFLELALLAPGSAPPAQGSELSSQNSSGFNVSGLRESSNNFLLDGVDNNDRFLNRILLFPSLDAIQEFTLLSNNYDAEFGRSAGAQVNLLMKSGGTRFHGSLFEYFRHSRLDARNFFEPETPFLRRSQFGGTLGGPLGGRGDFVFLSYEGLRQRRSEARVAAVPTLLERHGDFSGSGLIIRDPFTGQPFDQNRIPSHRIHPAGASVASLYPVPNREGEGSVRNLVASPRARSEHDQFAVKTDHRLSDRSTLFVRYILADDSQEFPFSTAGSNLPGFGTEVLDRGQNLAGGLTQVFSFSSVNELRFGFNRLRREILTENAGRDTFGELGIRGPDLPVVEEGFPFFILPGREAIGDDPNLPTVRRTRTFHFSDVHSLNRGNHLLKFGGEGRHYQEDGFTRLFARGQLLFSGAFTGDPLADLLLGFPTFSLLGSSQIREDLSSWSLNLFVQDQWILTPRLTLTGGLRYETITPPVDSQDRLTLFDPATASMVQVGREGIPRSGVYADRNNFAPRAGLAWEAAQGGRLVVRAGYGVYFDTGTVIEHSSLYFNPPNFRLSFFFTGQVPLFLDDPFPRDRVVNPAVSPFTLDPHLRTAYTQHWSLGLTSQSKGDLLLEARYVGTKATKLIGKRNLNQPAPGPGFVDLRRPIPGFGNILFVESSAASIYHGLQARALRRFSDRLSFLASYTFAKSIDNASSFLGSHGTNDTPQNSADLAAERGLSSFDLRQRFSLALSVDLPAPSRHLLLKNWQVSALLAIQSGRPFTPVLETDNSNTGNMGGVFGHDRPDVVAPWRVPRPSADRFFHPEAFAPPDEFSFGNAGRNILLGPGYASLDLSLARQLAKSEAWALQFRAEVFNTLNRANFRLPEAIWGRPTFGQVLSAHAAREIQLVVRLAF